MHEAMHSRLGDTRCSFVTTHAGLRLSDSRFSGAGGRSNRGGPRLP
jgi:hypothetical protein